MALRLDRVACRRGGRIVFSDLSLTMAAGEAWLLVGPNGAGKSSLLRMLAGLIDPAQGVISWRDEPIARDRMAYQADVLYGGHLDGVKAPLTPREHLNFWAALMGAPARGWDDLLTRWGLSARADDPARFLSAGQKRRLALARFELDPRPLWLMDEPDAALDRAAQDALRAMIARHCAQGGMALVASHDPDLLATARRLALGA